MSRKVNGSSLKAGDWFVVPGVGGHFEVHEANPLPLGHVRELRVLSHFEGQVLPEDVLVVKSWKYERLTPKEVAALNN